MDGTGAGMTESAFIAAVQSAIQGGNPVALREALMAFSQYGFKDAADSEPLSDDLVTFLSRMLVSDEFFTFPNAAEFLLFFETEWTRLSHEQKARLLQSFEKAFGQISEPIAWFTISEILGEYYCDHPALDAALRLQRLEHDERRSQIAHALEHMCDSSDPVVRSRASVALLAMQSDQSAIVRDEVEASLARLRARGQHGSA